MSRAEDIRIESAEDGFELHVLVEDWPAMQEDGWVRFNIHHLAPDLFEQVKRVIGSWLAEGEEAKAEYDRERRARPEPSQSRTGEITSVGRWGTWRSGYAPGFHCSEEDVDESAGASERVVAIREDGSYRSEPDEDAYDPTDPKHPDFHSVHADHYDNRDKTEGGRTF